MTKLFVPLVAVTLAALSLPQLADAQRLSKITGGKLLALCTNAKGVGLCDAYIAGVSDGLAGIEHSMSAAQGKAVAGATCIADSVSTATMRSTVVDYLRAHSDVASKPAAVGTFDALHTTFACKPATP